MTKQQIADQLQQWITDGKLLSKVMTKKGYYDVKKAVKHGELLLTKVVRVYATDDDTAKAFNKLVESKQVFTQNDLMLEYPELNTPYAVTNACARNEFLKFQCFGNIPLFIKGE